MTFGLRNPPQGCRSAVDQLECTDVAEVQRPCGGGVSMRAPRPRRFQEGRDLNLREQKGAVGQPHRRHDPMNQNLPTSWIRAGMQSRATGFVFIG
jgi:hypothetical protein